MIPYDPDKSLIFSHIPKTAGTSVRVLFMDWFGEGFLGHYAAPELPEKHDLSDGGARTVIYGHFNPRRGFGIEDYYPDVTQFMTILRDPWERALSDYYYRCALAEKNPRFKHVAAMSVEDYIQGWPYTNEFCGLSQLDFLPPPPDPGSLDSWVAHLEGLFVAIGVTEALASSMSHIADALGKPFDTQSLPHVNRVERPDNSTLLAFKPDFERRMALEYQVYQYFARPFDQASAMTSSTAAS